MKGGFRQSMSWLHMWCGLTCGWLLCAIFLTGTVSVFREPITRWMQAGPLKPVAAASTREDQAAALQIGLRYLADHAAGVRSWRMGLPERQGGALALAWRDAQGANRYATLDAATGQPLAEPRTRQTEGGRHFMSFHYTLHGGLAGYWLVGWITLGMLVALVSGVVVHKRLFTDFFTFRQGKGQRSWMDAHNATAVLTLPFLFMIGYTGLAFFYTSYAPLPLRVAYGADAGAYARFQAGLAPAQTWPREPSAVDARIVDPAPLLAEASALMGGPVSQVILDRPSGLRGTIRMVGTEPGAEVSRRLLPTPGSVRFDAESGAMLEAHAPDADGQASAKQVHEAIEALHKANFGGWTMKWLYFLSGLAGTAMVATGTLLFSIKRRKRCEAEFGAATARVYRGVEALNVASLAGVALASIAYFYANRLIPVDLADRAAWEIRVFFGIWAASLAHALLRPPNLAWREQLAAAALLCVCLPLLNWATLGQHLVTYMAQGDRALAAVELTAIGLGLLFGAAASRLRPDAGPARRGKT